MKAENRTLNLLKLIGCFCVVFIHASSRGEFFYYIYKVIAWAAPVFLMISGYYIYKKDKKEVLKKIPLKIKKMLKYFVICICIFTYLKIYNHVAINGNSFTSLVSTFFSLENIIKMVVFNCFDVIYGTHLWYLISIIWCYILLKFMLKHEKTENVIKLLIPIFLILRILLRKFITNDEYWFLYQNFLLSSFPYFFLGYFISKKK